jgi:RNA polymerase sigma-70 factor (ECF subfamily)
MVDDGSKDSMIVSVPVTDEQLLSMWQRGDRAALETIVRRHEGRLARIAHRITGCRHESEDVRHTVFVRFLQAAGEVRQVGAWLTRCTVNEAINRTRQRDREGRALADLAQVAPSSNRTSPLKRLQQEEAGERLAVALAQLTPDDRALLSLRFDEDLTFRQIADVLEKPGSTVKSQLSTAIARLRTLLGPSE